MGVGENLIQLFEALKSRGIIRTKQEFCNKLGITYKNFSKYVRNELKFEINKENYSNITLFSINISWLFSGTGSIFLKPTKSSEDVNFHDFIDIMNSIKKISHLDKQILLKYFSTDLTDQTKRQILELISSKSNNI